MAFVGIPLVIDDSNESLMIISLYQGCDLKIPALDDIPAVLL